MTIRFLSAFLGLGLTFSLAGCGGDSVKHADASTTLSVPLWPLSTRSEEAKRYVLEGERLADEGHWLKAYERFNRAVAADSSFAYAYLRVSDYALTTDEYSTNLRRAAAHLATATPVERLLVQASVKTLDGDRKGALDLLRQLVAMQPANPRAWWILGWQQEGMGQVAEARVSMQRAVDLAPSAALPKLNLGRSYLFFEPKDFAKAEQYLVPAQKLAPDMASANQELGALRRAQGRLQDAVAAYTRLIELDPQDASGYEDRGQAHTFLGEYAQARADFQQAIRLAKANELADDIQYPPLVSAYEGKPDTAIAESQETLRAVDGMRLPDPESAKLLLAYNIAMIALYNRRFDVAESAIREWGVQSRKVGEKLGSVSARNVLASRSTFFEGLLAAFKGDYAAAERKAARVIELRREDTDPLKARDAHALRGYIALFRKQFVPAVAEFAQGDPSDQLQAFHRALALEGAGRPDEAKALYRRIASHNFNGGDYGAVRNDAIARSR